MQLTKGLIGLAALIAGGLVTIDEAVVASGGPLQHIIAQPDTGGTPDYNALRQQADSALNILLERRKASERAQVDTAARPKCPNQVWPYYSDDCLVSSEGVPARRVVRIVGIENRAPTLSTQRVNF